MSKDIYDSLIPKGIREMLEIEESLSRHLPPHERPSMISNSTQEYINFFGLNKNIIDQVEIFNKTKTPNNTYTTMESSIYEMIARDIISQNLANQKALGINSLSVGYLEKFDELSRYSVLSEKIDPWNEALKIQEAFGLPDHIEKYLHGISLDRSIFQGFILESEYERAFEVTSALNTDSVFLGEIEISPNLDDEEGSSENQKIILPEEFRDRLKTVQFLPIKLFDQILNDPNLMRGMDPREFENLIAELMYKSGFENIIVTPRSNDKGRDILATKTVCDIPIMFAFECKRYSPENKIKPEIMRALLGTISHHQTKANKGVLVTTSSFSREAKSFIASESMLSGKDFNDLVKWINQVKK